MLDIFKYIYLKHTQLHFSTMSFYAVSFYLITLSFQGFTLCSFYNKKETDFTKITKN